MQWISVSHLIAGIICYCIQLATSARLPDIYWNSTNPIFRIDNTDHIIDVNRGNNKFEYDQVNLICPSYPKGTKEEDSEAYIIYNVSKEQYDTCTVNSDSRIIAVCDSPLQRDKYFTITFRSFTPQPGGLEFHPGKDYYFITTSTGDADGLHNKIGGRCKSAHMKVTFKVCCGANTQSSSNSNNKQSTPLSSSSTSPFSSLPANSNVSNTVNSNSSLTPPHISSLTATGSQGTPVPVQSSEPSRVLYSTSTVEPSFKSEFNRIPSPTFSTSIHDSVHNSQSNSHNPFTRNGHTTGHHTSRTHSTSTTHNGHFNTGHFSTTNGNHYPGLPVDGIGTRGPAWWKPPNKANKQTTESSDERASSTTHPRKGRSWLLIVAAGIAVGVACLIVCFLGVGRRLFIRRHKQSTVINYSI